MVFQTYLSAFIKMFFQTYEQCFSNLFECLYPKRLYDD